MEECRADRDTYCPGLKHQELYRCMEDHTEQLSEACRSSIATLKKKHDQVRLACASDEETFCAAFKTNRRELKACMKEYYELLTPECKEAITSIHSKPALKQEEEHTEQPCPMEACAQDFNNLCPQALSKEEARGCLISNINSLSEPCRAAVANMLQEHGMMDTQELIEPVIPADYRFWLVRLWWVYPTGLVLLIQALACFKIRQIKKMEEANL